MSLKISHWIRINNRGIIKEGASVFKPDTDIAPISAEQVYRHLQFSYPKFFKMDVLSKWAWIGAEILTNNGGKFSYEDIDKSKIALVLATAHGCIDVDRKYQQSILSIPSPALFVYTLSNIMLGEICIRHGFKGEQTCLVSDRFESNELYFWVNDLLENRGMEACLCGWVDAANNQHDVSLFWIGKNGNGITFSAVAMQQIHDNNNEKTG
ncbi:MAG TPA: hypothetical protein PL009_10505 [Flavipsychrobacter sp.]|nr:hypothetical protein [Flavipsychrobacter sp.]